MIQNMTRLNEPDELVNVLSHLNSRPNKILLWQNVNGKERRITQNARISKILFPQDEMILNPTRGEFQFHFGSYIYFFGLNRTTIFKATVLYHSRLKLVIRLPKQIMLANSRTEIREDLSMKDRMIELIHHAHTSSPFFISKLLDRSQNGFSFRSSLNNIVSFKKKDRIWVRSLRFDGQLDEGEVSHVTKQIDGITALSYWRVGVRL